VGRASLPFLNHCSAVFPDPGGHGQPLRPGSQLAVVSQGRTPLLQSALRRSMKCCSASWRTS